MRLVERLPDLAVASHEQTLKYFTQIAVEVGTLGHLRHVWCTGAEVYVGTDVVVGAIGTGRPSPELALEKYHALLATSADVIACVRGRIPVNCAPDLAMLLALRSPPCAWNIRWAMASPRPAPPVRRLRERSLR